VHAWIKSICQVLPAAVDPCSIAAEQGMGGHGSLLCITYLAPMSPALAPCSETQPHTVHTGINVAGGLGELAAILLKGNTTQLKQLLELVLFQNFQVIVSEFDAGSPIGQLLQSLPGERLYSMVGGKGIVGRWKQQIM
jgi:hypothetical protein